MNVDYPAIEVPATPEYVLAVLRDVQRQLSYMGPEDDDGAAWTFQTTIEEWRVADDWFDWRGLGRALNQDWGIQCSDAEWKAVLVPAGQKRLGDVCVLIARHGRRAVIRPARLFGCICKPAGAFLTVRSLLRQAGVAENIRPSTPLAPYTRRYYELFLGPVSRLSPGCLPPIRGRKPAYDAGWLGGFVGLATIAVGACIGSLLLMAAGLAVFVVGCALTWIAAIWILPASVEFGDLRTFRDLARNLAAAPAEPSAAADGGREHS